MRFRLKIELHSYWHAGSGQGDGPGADALVVRSQQALPYLPGRSVKGLLREAMQLAEDLGHVQTGQTQHWFGSEIGSVGVADGSKRSGMGRYLTQVGKIHVSNARLGDSDQQQKAWESWASDPKNEPLHRELFRFISQTALDPETGVVKEHSLRTIEVIVPLTLYSFVDVDNDGKSNNNPNDFAHDLRIALPLLRTLGAHRNRGLGRCSATLEEIQR